MSSRKELAEAALRKILTPNTDIIQEGTFELRPLLDLSDNECVNWLMEYFQNKNNPPEVHHLIAVILDNKLESKEEWTQVPEVDRTKLISIITDCYWAENDANVEKILLDSMLRICTDEIGYMKMLSDVDAKVQSEDLSTVRKALKTFNLFYETSPDLDLTICGNVMVRLSNFLSLNPEPIVQNQVFVSLVEEILKLLTVLSDRDQFLEQINMGQLLTVINSYTHSFILARNELIVRESLTCLVQIVRLAAMSKKDFSDGINMTVSLCLSIMKDNHAIAELRIQAMNVVGNICQMKHIKLSNMIESILDTGFLVMKEGIGGGNADTLNVFEIESFHNNHILPATAAFFQHFFKPRLAGQLLELLKRNPSVDGVGMDRFHRSAFFLLLGLIFEGCKEYIFRKRTFDMNTVFGFRTDDNDCVRAYGMFALIQAVRFAKLEQIEAHGQIIVPLLIEHLITIFMNVESDPGNSKPTTLNRVLEALNKCIALNEMEDQLQFLVTILLEKGKSAQLSPCVQRLAVQALTSLVSGNKGLFANFGQDIIDSFREFQQIAPNVNFEEGYTPWIELMIPLAENNSLPIEVASAIMMTSQNICIWSKDPYLSGQVYKLFSVLTNYPGVISQKELFMMVDLMLNDLSDISVLTVTLPASKKAYSETVEDFYKNPASNMNEQMEGITSETDFQEPFLSDDLESQLQMPIGDSDGDNATRQNLVFIPSEHPLVTKKIQIIDSLQVICMNTKEAYNEHLRRTIYVIRQLHNLGNDLSPNLRESLTRGMTQFTICAFQTVDKSQKSSVGVLMIEITKDVLFEATILLQNQPWEMIRLISNMIQFLKYGLKFAGKKILQLNPELKVQFMDLLDMILNDERSYWPLSYEPDDDEACGIYDDKSIFFDEVTDLVKYFGDSISTEEFVIMFANFYPSMGQKFANLQDMDRIFILGIIAESMKHISIHGQGYFESCLDLFKRQLDNESVAIRANSVYGLGEIALHSKNHSNRKEIAETLQSILMEKIKKDKERRVTENIIGALARLIISHGDNVALHKVLPEIFKRLPLKENIMENEKLFLCFICLYQRSQNFLFKHLGNIIMTAGYVLARKTDLAFEGTGIESAKIIGLVKCLAKKIMSEHAASISDAFERMKESEVSLILELN